MYMPTNKKVIKAFKEYTECRKKYPFNTVYKCKEYSVPFRLTLALNSALLLASPVKL